MRRIAAATLGLSLAYAGAVAWPQDPPQLAPPADLPPIVEAPETGSPAADPSEADRRPVLAIPAVRSRAASNPGPARPAPGRPTTPAPPAPPLSIPAYAGPTPIEDLPPLDAPVGAQASTLAPRQSIRPVPGPLDELPPLAGPLDQPASRSARPSPAQRSRPNGIALETVPEQELKAAGRPRRPVPNEPNRPSEPEAGRPRRGRFFGLSLPGPPAAREEPRSSISVEPRSDPASDAALKRRIEREARQILGDRARSVEIRVASRTVYIRAQGVRFLQRRSVRRTLETLPAASGLRTVVELVD